MRAPEKNSEKDQIKVGDIFIAEVIGIQKYGVFVRFAKDKKGLIHISELQSGYIADIHEQVKVGQKLIVQVIDRDEYTGKISLSARSLEEHSHNPQHRRKHFATDSRQKIGFISISKELAGWTRDAEAYLKNKE